VGSKARLLNLDASMSYFREALKIFKTIQDKDGQANVLEAIALGFRIQDKDNEAIKYFNQVLKLIGDNRDVMKADIFGDLANIYEIQNQFHLSLKFLKKSLDLKEKLKDENGRSQILIKIGLLYVNYQQVSMGLDYLQKALEILEELHSPDAKVVKQIIAEVMNDRLR
jgi:tetratricopeptide (TPR) repeat protein